MLRRYFRRILELDSPPPKTDLETPTPPPFPLDLHRRFDGASVPDEVTSDPLDSHTYASVFEELLVAPAREKDTVVVFPYYLAPGEKKGEYSIRDDDVLPPPDDEVETVERRMVCTRRIYAHISPPPGRERHPRIVEYAVATSTGYKLERPFFGPLYTLRGLEAAQSSRSFLPLYQQWALQALSALVFLHSKEVILHSLCDEVFWVREDLSIAVAGLMVAACGKLCVSAGPWSACAVHDNPWKATDCFREEPPFTEADTGSPRGDIFDWATWVYCLMTKSNPLHYGLDHMDEMAKSYAVSERQRKVERREFDEWPKLHDDMLGPVLLRAWNGEYNSASEALQDARKVLKASGVKLSTEQCDEIDGVEWRRSFVVERIEEKGRPVLRLSSKWESETADEGSEKLEEPGRHAGSGRKTVGQAARCDQLGSRMSAVEN